MRFVIEKKNSKEVSQFDYTKMYTKYMCNYDINIEKSILHESRRV